MLMKGGVAGSKHVIATGGETLRLGPKGLAQGDRKGPGRAPRARSGRGRRIDESSLSESRQAEDAEPRAKRVAGGPSETGTETEGDGGVRVRYDSRVQSIDDEALVLDTYPYSDRHLIVSVLTRRFGVHRGVLRRARGGKAPAAAIAQVLTRVRLGLAYRPQAELADIRHFDLITSSFPLSSDLARSTAAAVVAELLATFCPAGEPDERSFRLGIACLEGLLQDADPATVVAYAQFWTLTLGGVFPPHESITAALGETSRILAFYRSQPVGAVPPPSPEIARWLDQRVREEAERPLRALGFFRSLDV